MSLLLLQTFLSNKEKEYPYKYVKELNESSQFYETDLMKFESFAKDFRYGYTLNHLLHDATPARGRTHPSTAHPHTRASTHPRVTHPRARTTRGAYDNEMILDWLQQGQRVFDLDVDPTQMSWEQLDDEYRAMATYLGFDAERWDNDQTGFLGKW